MMTNTAVGTFAVELTPQPSDDNHTIGRMTLSKTFLGELVGSSRGEMLATQTDVEGSAGYVAMERMEASLSGRSGSFVLIHTGVMDRGNPRLEVQVVPDSGTSELVGITGSMEISIESGVHLYEFTYRFSSTD